MPSGRCECGSVKFEVKAVRKTVTVCHCSQCRRTSGHLWASTVAPLRDLHFIDDASLAWFQSSESAKRGFCNTCGASLFYVTKADPDCIAIAAGCLEDVTVLNVTKHIFVKDKADYYQICDGAEQL
ncbi:MAG: GFA family protein [Cognatishimia sp.]